MTDPVVNLAAAELRAARAREQLSLTLGQIQSRLDPRTIAQKAARDVGDAGTAAIETVRDRPGIVAGAAAIATLFFARHRIAALFGRDDDSSSEGSGLNPVTPNPAKRTKP